MLSAAVIAALAAHASGLIDAGSPGLSTTAVPASISTPSVATAAQAATAMTGNVAKTSLLAATPVNERFDRFIVKYCDGARVRGASAVTTEMGIAVARTGIAGAGGTAIGVQHVRKMAMGAEVIKLLRAVSHTEAVAMLAQLIVDPAVQFAQPDYRLHPIDFTPSDSRYDLQS